MNAICQIRKEVLADLEVQASKTSLIPVWEKINLTIQEASEYSNIGETTIRNLLKEKGCPFLLMIGTKHLIKRKEFEKYLNSKHYL